MKDEHNNNQNDKIVIELGMKTDMSLEVVFAFRLRPDTQVKGTILPVKDGFGKIIINMDNKYSFEFVETLQKAIDAFRAKLKDYAS